MDSTVEQKKLWLENLAHALWKQCRHAIKELWSGRESSNQSEGHKIYKAPIFTNIANVRNGNASTLRFHTNNYFE